MSRDENNLFDQFSDIDPDYSEDPIKNQSGDNVKKGRFNFPIMTILVIGVFSLFSMYADDLQMSLQQFESIGKAAEAQREAKEDGITYNEQGYIIDKPTEKDIAEDKLLASIGNINQSVSKIQSFYEIDFNNLFFGRFEDKTEMVQAIARSKYHFTKAEEYLNTIEDDLLKIAKIREDIIPREQKISLIKSISKYSDNLYEFYNVMASGMSININNYSYFDGYNAFGNRKFNNGSVQSKWKTLLKQAKEYNTTLENDFSNFKDNIKSIVIDRG